MTATNTRIGQRFKVGDRVIKRKEFTGTATALPPRVGWIVGVEEKKQRRKGGPPFPVYYYRVLWDDLKTPSPHAQQVLMLHD